MSKDIVEEAAKLVEEAKAPGKFSILNVLKERAYPHEEVNVYFDEQSAYEASKVKEKLDNILTNGDADAQDQTDELQEELDSILEKLNSSKYVFYIEGISEGMREDLMTQAADKFPIEYEEDKNPFTGDTVKKEIDNKERDRFFTDLLWFESIKKITAPDGGVQDFVTMEDVSALRKSLPVASIGAITQSIEKLRLSTAMFMVSVDEDFLAKS